MPIMNPVRTSQFKKFFVDKLIHIDPFETNFYNRQRPHNKGPIAIGDPKILIPYFDVVNDTEQRYAITLVPENIITTSETCLPLMTLQFPTFERVNDTLAKGDYRNIKGEAAFVIKNDPDTGFDPLMDAASQLVELFSTQPVFKRKRDLTPVNNRYIDPTTNDDITDEADDYIVDITEYRPYYGELVYGIEDPNAPLRPTDNRRDTYQGIREEIAPFNPEIDWKLTINICEWEYPEEEVVLYEKSAEIPVIIPFMGKIEAPTIASL